jgi:hypothetical protein
MNYTLNHHVLEKVSNHPYLGVELQSNLKWDIHINNITSKALQKLAFLRRNLHMCPEDIKVTAYNALVRPHLEYASSAWDPYMAKDVSKLEAVQRKAARFIKNERGREEGTMTRVMSELGWEKLEDRRMERRLSLLNKVIEGESALKIPSYIKVKKILTRNATSQPITFIEVPVKTDTYKFSYWPRTIRQWNISNPNNSYKKI